MIVGPLIGAKLLDVLGWWGPFAASAIFGLLALVLLLRGIEETLKNRHEGTLGARFVEGITAFGNSPQARLSALLIAFVVGLLVVPLQLALIPLLKLHLAIGIGKGYLGVWMAHTGFGLPLAIYLLRNYMVGLPKDIIENARVDGATDFQIFVKLILPLSFPALASFAIFQFLWTWNDLLVAKVFLIDATGQTTVMTNRIVEMLGTRGGNWEILATAAFVSISVPLVVFFALQKYLVRGLLAGSVK